VRPREQNRRTFTGLLPAAVAAASLAAPIAGLLAVLLATPAPAAESLELLRAGRSFKCLFNAGVVAEWDGPRVKRELTSTVDMAYHFQDVDRVDGTARMIGSEGTRSVDLIDSPTGLTFIDRTLSGNLSFTTIFAQQLEGGNFSAVHSRHVLLSSAPLPSQYYGICRRLD
jgi:hypothetical protein